MLKIFSIERVTPWQATVAVLAMAAVWLLNPEIVQAAVSFGEMGQNLGTDSKGIAKGVIMLGYVAGLIIGILGCVEMFKAGKRQGDSSYPGGLIKIVIGAMLLGIGALVGSGSTTFFGSDQTTGLGELGIK